LSFLQRSVFSEKGQVVSGVSVDFSTCTHSAFLKAQDEFLYGKARVGRYKGIQRYAFESECFEDDFKVVSHDKWHECHKNLFRDFDGFLSDLCRVLIPSDIFWSYLTEVDDVTEKPWSEVLLGDFASVDEVVSEDDFDQLGQNLRVCFQGGGFRGVCVV